MTRGYCNILIPEEEEKRKRNHDGGTRYPP